MANKAEKKNKNLIIGICCAVVVVIIAVVIAIVVATNSKPALNDSYFVSDDTKYVLSLDGDDISVDGNYAPIKTHLVYYYSGDSITGLKAYYEYADEATAKAASAAIEEELDAADTYKSIEVDGKYLILTANDSEYADLTKADVEEQIEFMEMLKNMDLDNLEDTSEEVEIIDDNEE